MNLSEFKAWFEGFTESMDGPPGEKAWKRIQDRIKSIKSDEATTKHVFHEFYERPWRRWYTEGPWWNGVQYGPVSAVGIAQSSIQANSGGIMAQANNLAEYQDLFDAGAAFNKLGRAEALSLTHTKLRG